MLDAVETFFGGHGEFLWAAVLIVARGDGGLCVVPVVMHGLH